MNQMPQKETILIVHGTWAAPIEGAHTWYQLSGSSTLPSFVTKLNAALERYGSPARCWAHCRQPADLFVWSGANAWIDRAKASSALAGQINELQGEGWLCHIIAHSHGGNVVAEALPQLRRHTGDTFGVRGTVVTLGTPFINAMSEVSRRISRRRTISIIVSWVAALLILALSMLDPIDAIRSGWRGAERSQALVVAVAFVLIALTGILYGLFRAVRRRETQAGWNEFLGESPEERRITSYAVHQ